MTRMFQDATLQMKENSRNTASHKKDSKKLKAPVGHKMTIGEPDEKLNGA